MNDLDTLSNSAKSAQTKTVIKQQNATEITNNRGIIKIKSHILLGYENNMQLNYNNPVNFRMALTF